jgi:hypothetical protein
MLTQCLCSVGLLINLLLAGQSAAAEISINGSFEFPAITQYAYVPGGSTAVTGWLTITNGVEWFNPADPGAGTWGVSVGFAQDGNLAIDLAPLTFAGGGIQQTFGTSPGTWYRVSFYAGTIERFQRVGTAQIDVSVASVTQTFDVVNHLEVIVWALFTFDFQATDSTSTLVFSNRQDANYHFAFIDNVSVSPVVDDDGDGVPDSNDLCPGTPDGEVVNENGCSIDQLCPCESPWKNHGQYVSCVAHAAEDFVAAGLITDAEKDAIVPEAGQSSCGK